MDKPRFERQCCCASCQNKKSSRHGYSAVAGLSWSFLLSRELAED
jgi:hypothetical protein